MLVPFFWIVILLICRWIIKNQKLKKRLLVLAVLIAVLFTNPYLYRSLMMAWQPAPVTLSPGKKYEAGIVLGEIGNPRSAVGCF